MLTARQPDAELADHCRRHDLALMRITGTGTPPRAGTDPDAGWIDLRLTSDAAPAGLRALVADPALTVLVRPDRVIAAVTPRRQMPDPPWPIPAAAGPGYPATAPPAAHPESVSPVTTTP